MVMDYGDIKTEKFGGQPWTAGIMWLHRSHDHWTRNMCFPVGDRLQPYVDFAQLQRYKASKILGSRLTFWGHVTSSVTSSLDSQYMVSYKWCIETTPLSRMVAEILHVRHTDTHIFIENAVITNHCS